jgi:hypothetical protein
MAEGPLSALWQELKVILPTSTYKRFADISGVTAAQFPTWADLQAAFSVFMEQRVAIGKLARSTSDRYAVTLREFSKFLAGGTRRIAQRHQQATGGTL